MSYIIAVLIILLLIVCYKISNTKVDLELMEKVTLENYYSNCINNTAFSLFAKKVTLPTLEPPKRRKRRRVIPAAGQVSIFEYGLMKHGYCA